MLRAAAAAALVLLLAGCSLPPIDNPVSPVNIYQAKIVYAETLDVADYWRDFCWARPYKVLMRDAVGKLACTNRRARLRALMAADKKAAGALEIAETFVQSNPSLDGSTIIRAAISAVSGFRQYAMKLKPN